MSDCINFIIANMVHVKYFFPLTIVANRRDIKSKYWLFWDWKPVDEEKTWGQHPGTHIEFLQCAADTIGFELNVCSNDTDISGVTFFGERRGITNLSPRRRAQTKRVVLTCMLDFKIKEYYDFYISRVDNVVFPSRWLAEKYEKTNDKNLYLGSPKYDMEYNAEEIRKKYGIHTDKKVILIFLPNDVVRKPHDPAKIVRMCHDAGYYVIAKTRHFYQNEREGIDLVVGNRDWWPDPSLELISACDAVVMFNTHANKECVMLNKPFVNFNITTRNYPFPVFYQYPFCKELLMSISKEELKGMLDGLIDNEFLPEFEKARETYLFQPGMSSSQILDAVL